MRLIVLEGLIGAGKSTLIKKLKKDFTKDIIIFPEPIEDFQYHLKFNPLKCLYEDPIRNGAIVQSYMIKCLYNQLKKMDPNKTIIIERSLYSSKIFTKTLRKMGFLSDYAETVLLNDSQNKILDLYPSKKYAADVVCYLNTPLEVCMERILERSREGENFITKEYMTCLQTEYNNYLKKVKNELPVYILPYNEPDLKSYLLKIIQEEVTKFS